ncbi:MAG: glycerate kinase [Planctomycetes bacterium]|nr:glycerate kinase [Planctomycetota bacterium]
MKIVVAADSFKNCLGALAVCEAMVAGIREANSSVVLACLPLADGGEGTADVLMRAMGGERIVKLVNGPMPGKRVKAGFVWCEQDQTAIVEMAEASGIQRIQPKDRNPMDTTSLGTGKLILAAVEKGAKRILLTVGGSATVDLGIGMACALGWKFLDHRGEALEPLGKHLLRIQKIVPPETPWQVPVEVLCDVTNPVLGFHGAAHVFAPQKGASLSDVVLLEVGLTQVVSVVKEQFGIDIQGMPGGGAAGGLAAGARIFMNATLSRGIDQVLARTHFQEAISDADWVVTGEGCLDAQSLSGKVISGVAQACQGKPTRVAVIAGQVHLEEEACKHHGIDVAVACTPDSLSRAQRGKQAPKLIQQAAKAWAEKL